MTVDIEGFKAMGDEFNTIGHLLADDIEESRVEAGLIDPFKDDTEMITKVMGAIIDGSFEVEEEGK